MRARQENSITRLEYAWVLAPFVRERDGPLKMAVACLSYMQAEKNLRKIFLEGGVE